MNIVGLKIEKGLLAASIVRKVFRKTELLDSFVRSFATDAELADLLRELAPSWASARIVSSIPTEYFSQRTVALPFPDRKRIEKALPFELEDSVPFSLDEVVLDHIPLGPGADGEPGVRALGLMLPKNVLRTHLELLAGAGVDPQVVVPSALGLAEVSRLMPVEGVAVLISGGDLCITAGGSIRALRGFSRSEQGGGLAHTLQALETELGTRVEKALLLGDDPAARETLAGLGISVDTVAVEFSGKKPQEPVSLGLALSSAVNFRSGEFAFRRADEGARKRKRTLIVAAAAAAVLFFVNIGVKVAVVRSGYGRLDREIREIYRQTFPEARESSDPLRQMRDKVAEAKKQLGVLGSGSSVLDVMKAVTEGMPKEVRAAYQEFTFEGDRLRLAGEATSFESVDKIKASLQASPLFAEVNVSDTRMGVENKVKFRMDIKLKGAP